MRHAGKACFAARRAARSFLSLLLPLLALLAPLAAPAATAIHLGSAAWQVLPGGTFGPPPALPALDASRWQATALPHVLPRAVVPQDDAEMTEAVHKAMQHLMDEGIWQEILDAWGVEEAALETAELNPAG